MLQERRKRVEQQKLERKNLESSSAGQSGLDDNDKNGNDNDIVSGMKGSGIELANKEEILDERDIELPGSLVN